MKILKWLAFGAAAYGVLRVMKAYGILEQPTGRVLDAIDGTFQKGIDFAQDQLPERFTQGVSQSSSKMTKSASSQANA